MTASYVITDTDGNDIQTILAEIDPGQIKALVTLRIYNFGTSAAGNLRVKILNRGGDELPLAAGWVELKIEETWTPITPTAPITLTPPAASAYLDIESRIVVPADAGDVKSLQALIRAEWW